MAFITTFHLQASADAALSCKPERPVARGGHGFSIFFSFTLVRKINFFTLVHKINFFALVRKINFLHTFGKMTITCSRNYGENARERIFRFFFICA